MPKTLVGLHVQWPWSEYLLNGRKTIETRSYQLPKKYYGQELALIETPGRDGKKAGIKEARIVGTIVFKGSFEYPTKAAWAKDNNKHLVVDGDPRFGWNEKKKRWAWEVQAIRRLKTPKACPKRRGIIFAKACKI